jgi:hypothetical protein
MEDDWNSDGLDAVLACLLACLLDAAAAGHLFAVST